MASTPAGYICTNNILLGWAAGDHRAAFANALSSEAITGTTVVDDAKMSDAQRAEIVQDRIDDCDPPAVFYTALQYTPVSAGLLSDLNKFGKLGVCVTIDGILSTFEEGVG